LKSRAAGVGHFDRAETASISVPPSLLLRGVTRPPFVPRLLVSVGQSLTAVASPSPLLALAPLRLLFPHTVGVGHKPESVALVRRPNVGSSQHCPAAVIPERGQVTEDSSESPSKQGWAVFHEDEAGSNFAHDARHVRPHSRSSAVDAGALSGDADVLAREAARNHINKASPWSSVKGANVIPNREGREKAVILSGGKYACGVGFPLDGANGAPSEQVAAENSSTSAREKSQLIHRFFLG
jgi:hypothetical protein